MNTISFVSVKTDAIIFPAEEMILAFLEEGSTALIVFLSLAKSGGPNTHHDRENGQLPGYVLLVTVSAWSTFAQASNDEASILRKPSTSQFIL